MFKAIGRFFKSLFNTLWRTFNSFLKKVGAILFNAGAAYILDVAREAVSELQATDLTNEQKRKKAFEKIKNYVKEKELNVRDSVINSVIELVVQELKDLLRS